MYQAAEDRYEKMDYKRCGRSGVKLPRVSLGLWQKFGLEKPIEDQEAILCRAFDLGVTHFESDFSYNFHHQFYLYKHYIYYHIDNNLRH